MFAKTESAAANWRACFTFDNLIGRESGLENAVRISKVAAKSSAPVLILGESGVGKELFAQSIHNASRRAQQPFVSINCGAIPRELIEAELFGYTPNSFTGASNKGAAGKFTLANGGTLFLDEMADLSMDAQVKLLRAISNSEIIRVGGSKPEKTDVRIICATNKNIQKAIEDGNFREDLYYRINVFEVHIPPLRERLCDINSIVEYFVSRMSKNALGENIKVKISNSFIENLKKYNWPGNVRQLQAVLEREIYHLSPPDYELKHIPDAILNNSSILNGTGTRFKNIEIKPLKALEEEMIKAALIKFDWDISRVCTALEISRATLYRKINIYKIKHS